LNKFKILKRNDWRNVFGLEGVYGQVPAVRLLPNPFRVLPEPMLVVLLEEMAEPSPVLAPKELLLTQATVDVRASP